MLPMPDPPITSRVRVPEEVAAKFAHAPSTMGGRQSYQRWLRDKLAASRTVHLTADDVRRIVDYSRGSGGIQNASRALLKAWYAQNKDNGEVSQRLREEVRAALPTPSTADYSLRHYNAISAILTAADARIDTRGRRWLAEQFADLFARDARDFDRARWMEACGFSEPEK